MAIARKSTRKVRGQRAPRKGVIAVVAAVSLVTVFAFVAFSVDTGLIVKTQTQMQNGVDAAALAAAQEINTAVANAGDGGGGVSIDANSIAVAAAREMAVDVAARNGVYIDGLRDVEFGKRSYDSNTGEWPIVWGAEPYNTVRVTAHRDNTDHSSDDSQLPLSFGWAVGKSHVDLVVSATAFIEARDLCVVLDFSGSMNDDSTMASFNSLGQSAVEDNLDDMWDTLVASGVTWPNVNLPKFPASGFGEIDSYYGTYISSTNDSYVMSQLDLDDTYYGYPIYPFPQLGTYSNGNPKPYPSASTSENMWDDYIDYVQGLSGTYRKRYGYRTLMNYLLTQREHFDESEDLWRTPHYPFHAIKNGSSLFLDFLDDLDFGDEVGLVSYDESSRVEDFLDHDGEYVDLSADPISDDYAGLDLIQRHKQAGHYASYTGMGYGLEEAIDLLEDHQRYGSRPTILLMTDGQANRYPSGWSMPNGFSWSEHTDLDGDGDGDYYTSNKSKQYAFYQAVQAINQGITIHTMSVGAGADDDLMEAIAHAGGGIWIDVPGGSTIAAMEDQLLDAFSQIAAKVPPAKLVYAEDE